MTASAPSSAEQAFLDDLDKKLWNAADRLRSNLDAAVYKHAILGPISSNMSRTLTPSLPSLLKGSCPAGLPAGLTLQAALLERASILTTALQFLT